MCHGIGSSTTEFCVFLRLLNIPTHVRILAPDQIGHGQDLKRAFSADALLESTSEFLDAVHVGPNCNALGTSLGGALVYYLRAKRPEIIQKTVLLAPALLSCLSDPFLLGLLDGKHGFMDFHSRQDVKDLFRNFLWTNPHNKKETRPGNDSDAARLKKSKQKDPYEVIYRMWQRDVPPGHHKALQDNLLSELVLGISKNDHNRIDDSADAVIGSSGASGEGIQDTTPPANSMYTATTNLDPDSQRLVVWPEEDQIFNPESVSRFFGPSIASRQTVLETIPNCGHVFHADGTDFGTQS